MAEINKIYKEAEYIIRLNETEYGIILSALINAMETVKEQYRGYDYMGLRENLLRGKK